MADGANAEPVHGRVWIRDGEIVDVTRGAKSVAGFGDASVVDVGEAFVLPGFIDMHNHLAYNALPLWSAPGRTKPWLHNKHWPDADTYTASITEPAWVYAKACPEALLGYVQVRAMAGGATAAQGWPTANRGYQTAMRNVDAEDAGTGRDDLIYTSVVTKTGEALATSVRRMGNGSGFIYHCSEGQRGSRVLRDYTDLHSPQKSAARLECESIETHRPSRKRLWARVALAGHACPVNDHRGAVTIWRCAM